MLRNFLAFVVVAGFSGAALAAENIQQSITSEIFYSGEDAVQYVEEPEYENVITETQYVAEPVNEGAVWPIAGSEADVEIGCEDNDCDKNGNTKIVTKVGSGLIIENNINTKGTGWSGGPNIVNDAPIPAGFDYECSNNAEMPLLRREMLEDDGGTVLAVSRSPRTNCNKNADSYAVFAERAGFKAETKTCDTSNESLGEKGSGQEIAVNEYVDAEEKTEVQNQVRSWVVASGQTLRQVLQSWCDKEGWDLVWTSSREYPIEASAVFKGRFIDVASALIRNFERATPIPYAKFYKGNRVVVVSTNEE